jgi:hypothetical protein
MSEDKSRIYGFMRALVVNNEDPEGKGRVMVWIPDIMPEVSQDSGIWAMPANQAIGGRNSEHKTSWYSGQCMIPPNGSYTWVFFENGVPSRPFYLGALNLLNSMVLPECRVGKQKSNKWVLFKSHEGRCIVISDDPYDCRVEITGKKRGIGVPPDGDKASVYNIDYNQTTILLDERKGQGKLLIRTWNGNSILLDIENESLTIKIKNDINIISTGNINIMCDNMNITTQTNCTIQALQNINLNSTSINEQTVNDIVAKSWLGSIKQNALLNIDFVAPQVSNDGGFSNSGCGKAKPTTTNPALALPPIVFTKRNPPGEN